MNGQPQAADRQTGAGVGMPPILPPLLSLDITPGNHNWAFWLRQLPDALLVSLTMRLVGLGPRAFARTYGVMDDRNLRRVLQTPAGMSGLKPRARTWFRAELLHRIHQWGRLGYGWVEIWGLMEAVMQATPLNGNPHE